MKPMDLEIEVARVFAALWATVCVGTILGMGYHWLSRRLGWRDEE